MVFQELKKFYHYLRIQKTLHVQFILPKNIYTNQIWKDAKKILHEIEHTKLRDIVKGISICFDPDDSTTNIEEDKETLKQYYEFANMITRM